jgi:hypothetical protein
MGNSAASCYLADEAAEGEPIMPVCALAPSDKKKLGITLGTDLARKHGKQRYYSAKQVKDSARQLGFAIDWDCWGLSLFLSPEAFAHYHRAIGEVCDYVKMRSEMTAAVTDGASSSWFDVDLSWLEWPDIDLGDVFDIFD